MLWVITIQPRSHRFAREWALGIGVTDPISDTLQVLVLPTNFYMGHLLSAVALVPTLI